MGAALGAARAAAVERVQVTREGSRYDLDLKLRVAVSASQAWSVLTDFDALPEIDPIVKQARTRPGADDEHLELATVVRACVLWLCRDLRELQRVTLQPDASGGSLEAVVVPAGSDFRAGHARWRVTPCRGDAAAACMHFRAWMVPDFWIPPWIGRWLLEQRLRQEGSVLGAGIERRVRMEWDASPAAVVRAP
ncbi:MAG TPA: SRPBCC family protein [Nevskiaceae bacterium]